MDQVVQIVADFCCHRKNPRAYEEMAKTKSSRRKREGNWSSGDHESRTAKRVASLNKKRRRRQQHDQAEEEDVDDGASSHQPNPEAQHDLPLHQVRIKKKSRRARLTKQVPEDAYKRSFLAHDNYEQIDSTKLRLATAQIQRKVEALKERLDTYDPVEEAKIAAQQEDELTRRMKLDEQNRQFDRQSREKAASEYSLQYAKHGVNASTNRRKANLKRKPRPGPESWKLRGAARPAWEVYEFDTRHVNVHVKAHEEANAKARRSWNVFAHCRGRFAQGDDSDDEDDEEKKKTPQPLCREYLSLLTQLGSIHLARKNYSTARKCFLETIELEGTGHPVSITNARSQLMNMYLSTNRPSSARKLWEQLSNDSSVWMRYSAALVEYVSWNLLGEAGSTAETAEALLGQAMRGNVYLAYMLAWPETFQKAFEYTEEIVEEGDHPQGSVLEAIEYACSTDEDRGMGMWISTEGSLDWVRCVILRTLTANTADGAQNKSDLTSWEIGLNREEEAYEQLQREFKDEGGEDEGGEDDDESQGSSDKPDTFMYAGMFRTAMDWLQDAGEFLKSPEFDYLNEPSTETTQNEELQSVQDEDKDKLRNLGNKSKDIVDESRTSSSSDSSDDSD